MVLESSFIFFILLIFQCRIFILTVKDRMRERIEHLRSEGICKVCLSTEVARAFRPCGHLSCCAACAKQMKECPICRWVSESICLVNIVTGCLWLCLKHQRRGWASGCWCCYILTPSLNAKLVVSLWKFDTNLGKITTEAPVTFQSDQITLTINLAAASSLCEIRL